MCLYYGAVCSIMLQKTDSHILKAILLKDGSECKSVMILYSQTQTNASRHIAALLSLKKKKQKAHWDCIYATERIYNVLVVCYIASGPYTPGIQAIQSDTGCGPLNIWKLLCLFKC